jgi:GNAT superfamily N-acetyltransferase
MVSFSVEYFQGRAMLRAVIDAVLERRGGRVLSLGSGTPKAVVLDYGCYRIPGGDPAADEANLLLEDLKGPCEIVVPDDDSWRRLIDRVFGDRVRDRSMQSFVAGADLPSRTLAYSREVPSGYRLGRLDADTAALAGPELSPHGVDVLGGPAGFVERGFGWGLFADDALACVSTSYAMSNRFVEVSIATHPDHRRKGLAACTASAMICEALDRNLEPHWNAFNPVSQRLARRLGFKYAGLCEILELDFK